MQDAVWSPPTISRVLMRNWHGVASVVELMSTFLVNLHRNKQKELLPRGNDGDSH